MVIMVAWGEEGFLDFFLLQRAQWVMGAEHTSSFLWASQMKLMVCKNTS